MGEDERRNKGGEHQELQDLDPNRLPHLEEILFGGDVDLDLPSLFPQKNSTSMREIESRESFFEVNNGGERVWEKLQPKGGEGDLL
jgi:hypothetical protein